jgi:riboflavin biosynthesis pyrimidine reductase
MQGAYQFLVAKGISFDPRDIFKEFGIRNERQDYRIIKDSNARTRHNSDLIETRGRKSKVTGVQIREADQILQEEGLELKGKDLT